MCDKSEKQILRPSFKRRAIQLGLLLLVVCFLSPELTQPSVAQNGGKIRMLSFTVKTGDDDLRGGNDNLNVGIKLKNGSVQFKPNVNRGQRWADNTTQSFDIRLDQPVAPADIVSIEFQKPTGGGYGTDEWHMASASVRAVGGGIDKVIASHGFIIFDWKNQQLVMPVTMAVEGKANKLELTFKTGDDDLRGGKQNLDLTVHFRGGGEQFVQDINGGRSWPNDSTRVATVTLDRAVDPSDIVRIDLRKFAGALSEAQDNWNMNSVSVRAIGAGVNKMIVTHGFNRFTGTTDSLSIPITQAVAGKANKLELTIQTGGDDLRGDSDNLNVIIHFRGGSTQSAHNINGGKAWQNESMHVENITLNHAADVADIVEVDLETTFTGGSGGDNWDMDSVIVKALGEGVNEVILRGGPKRFTGDSRTLRLRKGQ